MAKCKSCGEEMEITHTKCKVCQQPVCYDCAWCDDNHWYCMPDAPATAWKHRLVTGLTDAWENRSGGFRAPLKPYTLDDTNLVDAHPDLSKVWEKLDKQIGDLMNTGYNTSTVSMAGFPLGEIDPEDFPQIDLDYVGPPLMMEDILDVYRKLRSGLPKTEIWVSPMVLDEKDGQPFIVRIDKPIITFLPGTQNVIIMSDKTYEDFKDKTQGFPTFASGGRRLDGPGLED